MVHPRCVQFTSITNNIRYTSQTQQIYYGVQGEVNDNMFRPFYSNKQGRIKLFGAPRQWKHFRPLFQAVFLSRGEGYNPPEGQTPRLPVPRQK